MSTRIAFIGLGIMGAPMAANLVKAGFHVTGYNRSPARAEQLAAAGTDMLTGLYSAGADSIPILCITGRGARGQAALHEDFQAVNISAIAALLTAVSASTYRMG